MIKQVNTTFFDNIDSELKAYILGFYLGDGCLSKGRLQIGVSEKDEYIVKLFRDNISPNSKLCYTTPNRLDCNEKPNVRFSIQNKNIASKLREFGYGENKTYLSKSLPNISESLFPHFLRGYFDADGSISFCFSTRKTGRQKGYETLLRNFCITSKDPNILYEIQSKLKENNISTSIGEYKKAASIYTCNLLEINKLYELLYTSATYFLNRKKEMFKFTMKTSREIRELKDSNPCNA